MKNTNKDEHRKYYHDGKEIPSCTTIVGMLNKPELVGWANHMGFKGINTSTLLEEKATYGTYCHKAFETYFNDGIISLKNIPSFLSKKEYFYILYRFRLIELYFQKLGIKVISTELPLEGKTYGGTLDMLCYNSTKDCLMVFDLKTSKDVRQSHWIQIMGYVKLLEEIYNLPVKEIGVLLLSQPLDSPKIINIRTTKDCWREAMLFDKLRDAYYILNEPEEIVKKIIKDDLV